MKVLVVQSSRERKNRVPDFSDPHLKDKLFRVFTIKEAISSIKEISPGLVIVDVEIENGSGFNVFEETKDVTYDKIILTDTPSHVFKSIRFNVSQYLLKPLRVNEIHDAVVSLLFKQKKHGIQRLFKRQFHNSGLARLSHLFVPTTSNSALVEAKELMMVEDLGYLRRLYYQDGQVLDSTASIQRLGMLLRGHGFERIGDEVLIHARHVEEILTEGDKVWAVMPNGRRLLVSYQVERRIRHRWNLDDIRPPHPG